MYVRVSVHPLYALRSKNPRIVSDTHIDKYGKMEREREREEAPVLIEAVPPLMLQMIPKTVLQHQSDVTTYQLFLGL